jgi:hypothetical protein
MEGREELMRYLADVVGDEGCGGACDETSIFNDGEFWKLYLCGFMEPWHLGRTADEAKKNIESYARMGFGLSG